jgi:hypothetical protein
MPVPVLARVLGVEANGRAGLFADAVDLGQQVSRNEKRRNSPSLMTSGVLEPRPPVR